MIIAACRDDFDSLMALAESPSLSEEESLQVKAGAGVLAAAGHALAAARREAEGLRGNVLAAIAFLRMQGYDARYCAAHGITIVDDLAAALAIAPPPDRPATEADRLRAALETACKELNELKPSDSHVAGLISITILGMEDALGAEAMSLVPPAGRSAPEPPADPDGPPYVRFTRGRDGWIVRVTGGYRYEDHIETCMSDEDARKLVEQLTAGTPATAAEPGLGDADG
jgi:hypothetical protein